MVHPLINQIYVQLCHHIVLLCIGLTPSALRAMIYTIPNKSAKCLNVFFREHHHLLKLNRMPEEAGSLEKGGTIRRELKRGDLHEGVQATLLRTPLIYQPHPPLLLTFFF